MSLKLHFHRSSKALLVIACASQCLSQLSAADRPWEDPSVFEVNTLPPSSPIASPIVMKDGKLVANPTSTHRVQILNGGWKFHLAPRPAAAPENFELPEYDDGAWPTIRVPSSWQTQGFGLPIYTNHGKPWSKKPSPPTVLNEASAYGNPTGCYRTSFQLSDDWLGRRIILHFAGANSAIYVWLNGQFLGYSEDGFLPAEFDITEHAKKGSNQLSVKVLRWCDGSYLETWDTWRLSGIFRDVYLYETPKTHIRDYEIRADLSETLKVGSLGINAWVQNTTQHAERECLLRYQLLDGPAVIAEGVRELGLIPAGEEKQVAFSQRVNAPKLWSAENPALYTVRLELLHKNEVIESLERKTGFRRVERSGNQMLVNGQPITIKGVNRVEFDPDYGRHVPYEVLVQDLHLMKQHNVNTIRLAIAPHHPALFELCDTLGLYLINEVNNETNSKKISDGPDWTAMFLDRTRRLVERDKNHPSIIIWSLGNESAMGRNMRAQADWIRERDPSGRLIQYTRNGHQYPFLDTYSQTYPSLRPNTGRRYTLREMHNDQQPVILNEYAHSMGNATGNMKEYMALFENESLPGIQGGCIWDFIDQGLRVNLPDGSSYFDYGATFGKTYDANFCINGIVFPDRSPQPALQEVKSAYQPLRVRMADVSKPQISLMNRHFFEPIESITYALNWSVTHDGHEVESGRLDSFSIPPRQEASFELPATIPGDNQLGEWALNTRLVLQQPTPWAEAGHVVSHSQTVIKSDRSCPLRVRRDEGTVAYKEVEGNLWIESPKSSWVFDKSSGRLTSWKLNDGKCELLADQEGPRFTAWRAPIDNDTGWSNKKRYEEAWFKQCALGRLSHRSEGLKIEHIAPGHLRLSVAAQYHDSINQKPIFKVHYHYNFMADGSLLLGQNVGVLYDFKGLDLPRIGVTMTLPDEFSTASWYGRGPHENYTDRHLSAPLGRYTKEVDAMYVPYVKPQANGNRFDVRELSIRNQDGLGLLVRCAMPSEKDLKRFVFPENAELANPTGGRFEFTALPYSEGQLESASVTHELRPTGRTFLTLDIAHAGVGNLPNQRLDEYKVHPKDVTYALVLEPLNPDR